MPEKPTNPETKKPKFTLGQTVRVLRSKGVMEDDWRVAQYAINGTSVVVMKRNESGKQLSRTITEKELSGWQTPTPKVETKVAPTISETGWAFADLPEEETAPKKIEIEEKDFISEFNLGSLLPEEFKKLDEAQKLKVIRDLKRRIVDIVKSDAETQYSEDLKQRKGPLAKIRASLNKELEMKDFEKKAFIAIRDTKEGKKIIADNLELLTKKTKGVPVAVSVVSGKPEIIFLDKENTKDPIEKTAIFAFNVTANKFQEIPYEWGLEGNGKHKRAYEKAKAEYEEARKEILIINEKKTGAEKKKAMVIMLELDNIIQMEQLLSTHPEFEKVLDNFAKGAGGTEYVKTAGNFLNTITGGENWTNKLLFIGGYGARVGVKAASAASGMSIVGALGSTLVGGTIGGLRARFRAQNTLEERKQQARRGKKDESKERVATTDATRLIERLEDLMTIIGFSPIDEKQAVQQSKTLSMLATRIEHTQGKIEKGQVNFGDSKSVLINQFNLVNTLNKALVLKELMSEKTNRELKGRIDRMLETLGKNIAQETSEAQNKFITKQMWQGAKYGAGFAFAGYGVSWLVEHVPGWWGGHGTEHATPASPKMPGTVAPKAIPGSTVTGTPVVEHINGDAIIKKGEGIENAFRRQIEHNADLAKKLGFNGEMHDAKTLHAFSGRAAHELAKSEGYIGPNGQEIRVSGGGRAFYEIKIGNDGQPIINEGEVGGTFREVHHAGQTFEQNTEKYEYKGSGHHETIHRAVPKTPTPEAHIEVPHVPEHHDIAQTFTGEHPPVHLSPAEIIKPRASLGNFTYGTTNEHGVGVNNVYGTGSGHINRDFYSPGGEHVEYYFPDLSPAGNDFLNHHLDFVGKNPFHLTGEQLIESYNASEQNINHFWGHDIWENIKNYKATDAIKHTGGADRDTTDGKLGDYLTILKNFSGLKPKGASMFHWHPETVAEFQARALQKIEANGQLEIFEDNVGR